MPNKEHVRILRQGVEVWNAWRKEHIDIWPDFTEANFCGADLSSASLAGATFFGAQLRDTDFTNADLTDTNFTKANLASASLANASISRANFSLADLSNAKLCGLNLYLVNFDKAYLSYADLSDSLLFGTIFRGSNMAGARLSGARLADTVFANTNLQNVVGLDSCLHHEPSTLDFRTLQNSDHLPLSFLRGCGLPDTLIEYLPSLLAPSGIQFYSCFISYSEKDREFAERLYRDLQNKGVRCWYAPEDLKIGDKFWQGIDQAIRVRDKVLLVLSESSLASEWVETEVEATFREERKAKKTILFPIRIDDAVMDTSQAWAARIQDVRHIGDFTNWKDHDAYQKAFGRLMRDLKEETETPKGDT